MMRELLVALNLLTSDSKTTNFLSPASSAESLPSGQGVASLNSTGICEKSKTFKDTKKVLSAKTNRFTINETFDVHQPAIMDDKKCENKNGRSPKGISLFLYSLGSPAMDDKKCENENGRCTDRQSRVNLT